MPQNKPLVESKINTQTEQRNYILASKKPAGAIPKANGLVQIIHDDSLPEGLAVNDCTDHHCVHYKTKMHTAHFEYPLK